MQIKILYAQGRAYENKKDKKAIVKFNNCLSLIGENKTHELYLSTLYHLALNQQANKEYIDGC